MKRERSGISLLLGSLLALSMLISAVYGSKPQGEHREESSALETVTVQEAYDMLLPLMQADSVSKIVASTQNVSPQKAHDLLELMVRNAVLSQQSMVEVIGGVALQYKDKDSHYKILDTLLISPSVHEGLPWPLIMAYSEYPESLKILIEWARERRARYPLLKRMIGEAFDYAIKHNNVKGLHQLHAKGAPLSPLRASKMLIKAAEHSMPEVAQFFIEHGADVNYVRHGSTPLIQAVKNLNNDMVTTLLHNKADANKMGSIEVGTPVQNALKLQKEPGKKGALAIEIETRLRAEGAMD